MSATDDHQLFEVDCILDERKVGRRTEYLVKWMDGHESTWLAYKDVRELPALDDWLNADDVDDEVHDGNAEIQRKVNKLAALYRQSKLVVFHTGAGCSASAGLRTFRGKDGLWTKASLAVESRVNMKKPSSAQPTPAHRAIVALYNRSLATEQSGGAKRRRAADAFAQVYCVTQNYDNLHARAGLPRDRLSELHGNLFVEQCRRCGRLYERDFEVEDENADDEHLTGRLCESSACDGALRDLIVHFGEDLPADDMERAERYSREADLHVVLGSKLEVQPAASLPFIDESVSRSSRRRRCRQRRQARTVIVNLQRTECDNDADIVIHAPVDQVMTQLIDLLGISVAID
jgi:NAD-dependent protein deacetylase sirtuin 6